PITRSSSRSDRPIRTPTMNPWPITGRPPRIEPPAHRHRSRTGTGTARRWPHSVHDGRLRATNREHLARIGVLTRCFRLERVTGIEPASPAWKAGALAIELHPRAWRGDDHSRSSHRRPLATRGSVCKYLHVDADKKICGMDP